MKKITTTALAICLQLSITAVFGKDDDDKDRSKYQREAPATYSSTSVEDTTATEETEEFKPSFNVGGIVHMFASTTQSGFGSPSLAKSSKEWNTGFSLYRARILVGGQLSKNGAFFLETEIPSIIGGRLANGDKNVKVAQIILDCQYEHNLGKNQMVVIGQQLVSHNRNGLQGAASLMANDFTFFQYPYNLFANSPLQGNFGRDLGVNYRGFAAAEKLEYRLGLFSGRTWSNGFTPRVVGRVAYNFLNPEKDYYYAGTKIGGGKTVALAGGFDAQGTYINTGADLFVDVPAGEMGSVTLNSAFSYMTGGTDTMAKFSFAQMIPAQTTQFLELGYYFKESKLQPWIRYERQGMATSDKVQTGGMETALYNDTKSATVFGGGLNYWFNGYGTNLRLSYTTWNGKVYDAVADKTEKKSYGQIWMQLQFFLF